MPPNVLLKAAFVRGGLENDANPGFEQKEVVRTDFILQNIFSYSIKKSHPFPLICALSAKEEYVLKELKGIYDSFLFSYEDNIKGLCCEIEVTEGTIGSVIQGVSNELFNEGVTWSRIIALFAFVGVLTLQCLTRKFPVAFVDVIYECFCRSFNENLKYWVLEHEGWEGVTTLSVTQGNTNSLKQPKPSNSSWSKNIWLKTVQVVGTLAQLANASSHGLP